MRAQIKVQDTPACSGKHRTSEERGLCKEGAQGVRPHTICARLSQFNCLFSPIADFVVMFIGKRGIPSSSLASRFVLQMNSPTGTTRDAKSSSKCFLRRRIAQRQREQLAYRGLCAQVGESSPSELNSDCYTYHHNRSAESCRKRQGNSLARNNIEPTV